MTGAGVLPTFIVIGAAKSGTSSLWSYLRQHPDIFLPDNKEPGYFVDELRRDRGRDWYESLFEEAGGRPVRGEASTSYTMLPTFARVPERMHALIPDVKLVYVVRDPVDRMISAWRHAVAIHTENRSIEDTLLSDLSYVAVSQYGTQMEYYLGWFDASQLLVVKSEDLRADPAATLARVCAFIGADPGWKFEQLSTLHNTADDKLMPRSATKLAVRALTRREPAQRLFLPVRRVPFAGRLLAQLSSRRRLLYREFRPEEYTLDAGLRERLEAYLLPDVQRLTALCGSSFQPWAPYAKVRAS